MNATPLRLLAPALLMLAGGATAAQPRSSVVRLVATDFAFDAPARAPGGDVTVRLLNRGRHPHYALLYRLGEGRTAGDFLAWRRSRTAPPAWLQIRTGPAPVAPGDSTDVTLRLEPGRYLVVCGYPLEGGGGQHVDRGMVRELELSAPPRAERRPDREAARRGEIALVLDDSVFRLDATVRPGRRTIAVENRGTRVQQALIVRLPAGVEVADEQRWFDEQFRAARPGVPSGGALRLAPGDRLLVARTFAPGRYVVLSHASGPWQSVEFTVAPASGR